MTAGGCGTPRLQLLTPGAKPRPPVLAILASTSSYQSGTGENGYFFWHPRCGHACVTLRGSCISSGVAAGLQGCDRAPSFRGREAGAPAVSHENILPVTERCPDPRCSATPRTARPCRPLGRICEGPAPGTGSHAAGPLREKRPESGTEPPGIAPARPDYGPGPLAPPLPQPPPPRGSCRAVLGAGGGGRSPPIAAAGYRDGRAGRAMSEALSLGNAGSAAGSRPIRGAGAGRGRGGASRPRGGARGRGGELGAGAAAACSG